MQTLIPATTMTNIKTIAKTLWEQRYRVELKLGDGLFRVFNLDRPESDYTVDTRGGYSCECRGFEQRHVCRHTEGLVLLIQSQICSYNLRKSEILVALKRHRGTVDYLAGQTARVEQLDAASWELECALCDLTGQAEWFMPRRLTGYVPELSELQANRKAA